jgi:hypothetical protein
LRRLRQEDPEFKGRLSSREDSFSKQNTVFKKTTTKPNACMRRDIVKK